MCHHDQDVQPAKLHMRSPASISVRLTAYIATVVLAVLASSFARAEDWVGKKFMPRLGYKVYTEDRSKVSTSCPGLPWQVTAVEGDWCRLGSRYWIRKADLVELSEAPAYYTEELITTTDRLDATLCRGHVYKYLNKPELALIDYTEVIRMNPAFEMYFIDRAEVYYQLGMNDKAIADLRESIRLEPNYARSSLHLAWLLSTAPEASARNGREAWVLASKLLVPGESYGAGKDDAEIVLAAAYAECGDFENAGKYQELQVERMKREGYGTRNPFLKAKFETQEARLKLYKDGKPSRDSKRTLDWDE